MLWDSLLRMLSLADAVGQASNPPPNTATSHLDPLEKVISLLRGLLPIVSHLTCVWYPARLKSLLGVQRKQISLIAYRCQSISARGNRCFAIKKQIA